MKRRVQFNRKDISSEEIKRQEDFDSVLKRFNQTNQPIYKNKWVLFGVAASIIAVSTIFLGPLNTSEQQFQIAELSPFEKFINPPMPHLKEDYEEYIIQVDEASVIHHHTGSKINIPKRAFVDENGKELSGQVIIKYREFHDQIDILMSGIPMQYDSGGTSYQLESAGMMDILGEQNGKPVFIKDGVSLDVDMLSNKDGDGYNLYRLDTVARNWENLENNLPANPIQIGDTSGLTDTPSLLSETSGDNTRSFDNGSMEDILLNEVESIKEELAAKEEGRPAPPRLRDDEKYVFEVDILAEDFPELADYNGAKFQVIEEKSDFDESYYNVEWSGLELKRDKSTPDEYIMIVSKGKRSHKLKVLPVFEEEDYEKAKLAFDDKFDKYKVALEEKRAALAKKMKDYEELMKKVEEERIAENKRRAEERNRRNQEEERRARERDQLIAGEVEFNQDNFIRNLTINRFGIYNCDSPTNWLTAYPTKFVTEEGDSISGGFHHIDKNINTVYRKGMYDNSKVINFRHNPNSENIVLIFLDKEKVAVFHQSFYRDPSQKEVEEIKMKVYGNFESVKELKDILNI